jgi:hypothetical protein
MGDENEGMTAFLVIGEEAETQEEIEQIVEEAEAADEQS